MQKPVDFELLPIYDPLLLISGSWRPHFVSDWPEKKRTSV